MEKTNEPNHIFVYGTLLPEVGARASLMASCTPIGRAAVLGKLHDLGSYPGFKQVDPDNYKEGDEKPTVQGVLFALPENLEHKQMTIRSLDTYEGHPHLFKRIVVECGLLEDETEATFNTYIYEYQGHVYEHALIKSGDWLERIGYYENGKKSAA